MKEDLLLRDLMMHKGKIQPTQDSNMTNVEI